MNIKLKLQYNGARYHGWQIQPNAVTIQETVQTALSKIIQESPLLKGCGRTDAGVHAMNYVCNFHTESRIPPENLVNALNAYLPKDIVCHGAEYVADTFHARESALGKRYIYRILNAKYPDAFLGNFTWHYKYPLDMIRMQQAAEAFIGEHDFIGFASSGFSVKTTIRTIHHLQVQKEHDMITIDITGNGFLYNMVRIIAGTLVFVGCGKILPEDIPEIILSKCRARAGITAPAHGLCLKEVYYEWQMIKRSEKT